MATNFYVNCNDDWRCKILETLIENGGTISNIKKFISSFKDIRLKKNFFINGNFSLQALQLNNYKFWLFIIQQLAIDGLEEMVEEYVEKYPDLLYALDKNGQFSILKALPAYKSMLQSHLSLWHDRYLVTDNRPIYISSTCAVYKAIDYSIRDKQGYSL